MQWHKAAVSWLGTAAQQNSAGSLPQTLQRCTGVGDCTPACKVDLHRCKCSGTRLLSAGLAQQHRATRQAVNPKHSNSALVLVIAQVFAEWIFIGIKAVTRGSCQLAWHSSTEEQGRQFTPNIAAVHWCLVTAHLYAEWISIGVNPVAQGCCQLVWHSSTEGQGRQLTLKAAVVHWCLVTASLYAVWISIGVNAVAQSCCQLLWHSSTEEEGKQLT